MPTTSDSPPRWKPDDVGKLLALMHQTCGGDPKCRPELSLLAQISGLPKDRLDAAVSQLSLANLIVVTRRTFAMTQAGIDRARAEQASRRAAK